MNIKENELIEAFKHDDKSGYNYLINNIQNQEKIDVLLSLKIIYMSVGEQITLKEYIDYRNIILKEEIGLSSSTINQIPAIEKE